MISAMSQFWSQCVDYASALFYRRLAQSLRPTKLVAVVVPLSFAPSFTAEERLSLRHLDRHLGRFDRFFVAPPGLAVDEPGFACLRFPARYFGSAMAHRDLVVSPGFYAAFRDYRFILLYHLDALVFANELERWCDKGYDYIGAPWIPHPDAPYAGQAAYENKVGCGGFSLRRVEAFMRLLVSPVPAMTPGEYAKQQQPPKSTPERATNAIRRGLMHSSLLNNVRWELGRLPYLSEERFLANRAAHYLPEFNIAPVDEALRFAFECVPRHCFELNGRAMPFGCHAWQRYDRTFWEPHLLNETVEA